MVATGTGDGPVTRGDGFGCDPVIVLFVVLLAGVIAAAFDGTGTILLWGWP
jgi:hypothetical protein